MTQANAWSDFSNDAHPLIATAVRTARQDSCKIGDAITATSERLGLPARMVRSILYSEPVRLSRERYDALLARWWFDMDRQAEALRRRAEELETQAAAVRVADAQLTLPLEAPCVERSTSGPASGARPARSGRPSASPRLGTGF